MNFAQRQRTSRKRVLTAVERKEPDRVPIDLGGTLVTGIMAQMLDRLRRRLGLQERRVKVYDVFQILGEVEMDVVERLHIDVLPVKALAIWFNIRRENYKPWKLFDSTPVLVPGGFYNKDMKYIVEPGKIKVMIGSSSEDIWLTGEFEITGEITEISGVKKFFTSIRVK